MNQEDLRQLGPQGFFDGVSPDVRQKALLAWRRMTGPTTTATDDEAVCEIFCNVSQFIGGGKVEVFNAGELTDINIPLPTTLQNLSADQLVETVVSAYPA